MKQHFFYTVATILSISAMTYGQTARTLSLADAVSEGLKNSHTLHAAQSSVDAAKAGAALSKTTLLPTLTAGGTYTRLSDVPGFEIALPTGQAITINDPILNSYGLKATVEQPLFTGGRLQNAARAQEQIADAARADYATNRRELVFQIQQAYWQLYKANEFKAVVDDNAKTVDAHLKDVQNMKEQGIVTNAEVLAVEVQLSNVQLLQVDAANNVRLATVALCNLIGWPLDSELRITTQLSNDIPAAIDGDAVASAQKQREEIQALEHKIQAAKAGIKAAQGGWLPQVRAFANLYYSRPNPRIFPARDEFDDTWDLGIGAAWTLWNWGGTAQSVKQAKAQTQQAEAALEALKDGIAVEVTSDQLAIRQAQEKIRVAEAGARFADENFRTVREKFKNGLAPNSDLLDAEDNLLKARWSETQARVDFAVAQARLRKSSGEDIQQTVSTLQ